MPTVTIACDNCGVEFQVMEALANSKSVKVNYCSEECWVKHTDKLNALADHATNS